MAVCFLCNLTSEVMTNFVECFSDTWVVTATLDAGSLVDACW